MHTFGSGKISRFERVDFSLYVLLSPLFKFKKYSGSTQTFTVAKTTFDLIRLMFALFFACQMYVHVRYFTKSKQIQAVYRSNIYTAMISRFLVIDFFSKKLLSIKTWLNKKSVDFKMIRGFTGNNQSLQTEYSTRVFN